MHFLQHARNARRKTVTLTIASLMASLACVSATASASTLIVQFDPNSSGAERRAAVAQVNGSIVQRMNAIDAAVVDVPGTRSARAAIASRLDKQLAVRSTQPDTRMSIAWEPGDPRISEQWHIAALGTPAAWDLTRGAGVLVAVVDTGVDSTHEDLQGRVVAGKDYVDQDGDPSDEQGHGTHVAGIIAASTGNGIGVAGIAPDAQVLAVRALDADGSGYVSDIATGVIDSADAGAKVINLSLGGGSADAVLSRAITYANSKGAIVTCASGNESARALGFPAMYNGCIAVGASTQDSAKASFSNRGANLDIAAPGTSILSSTPYGQYEAWDGTSMATPVVSGVAALLYAQGRSRQNVIGAMLGTATDAGKGGWDPDFGWGIVNAQAAVNSSTEMAEAPVTTVSLGKCGNTSSRRCKRRQGQNLAVTGRYSATTSSSQVQLVFSKQQGSRFVTKFRKNVRPSATGVFNMRLSLASRRGTWRVQAVTKAGWNNLSSDGGQAYFQVK